MNKQVSYDEIMLPAEVDDFVGVLRYRAALTPDRQAFGFLRDAGTDEDVLTYAELDRDARVIAAKLQDFGMAGKSCGPAVPAGARLHPCPVRLLLCRHDRGAGLCAPDERLI